MSGAAESFALAILTLIDKKMESDELAKVNVYLSKLRGFGAIHLSPQRVDMLETTTNPIELIRSRTEYSNELLDLEQIVHNLR